MGSAAILSESTTGLELALAQLAALAEYEREKLSHELFDAIETPLPRYKGSFDLHDGWHCTTEDTIVDPCKVTTMQPYVYRTKLRYYILHPQEIEEPQLHRQRYWWRASVFVCGDALLVGNGNHRVAAALLLQLPRVRVRLLERRMQ